MILGQERRVLRASSVQHVYKRSFVSLSKGMSITFYLSPQKSLHYCEPRVLASFSISSRIWSFSFVYGLWSVAQASWVDNYSMESSIYEQWIYKAQAYIRFELRVDRIDALWFLMPKPSLCSQLFPCLLATYVSKYRPHRQPWTCE